MLSMQWNQTINKIDMKIKASAPRRVKHHYECVNAVRLLYLILVLWMDRTSAGLRSHRTFTSLHSDGGPYSLPATVRSRSDCDYTEVSLSDAQGHGQPICQDRPAARVFVALFVKRRSLRTCCLACPSGSCTKGIRFSYMKLSKIDFMRR